jgi:hypothetical protein
MKRPIYLKNFYYNCVFYTYNFITKIKYIFLKTKLYRKYQEKNKSCCLRAHIFLKTGVGVSGESHLNGLQQYSQGCAAPKKTDRKPCLIRSSGLSQFQLNYLNAFLGTNNNSKFFSYLTEKRKIVLVLNVSPGTITAEGNSGLFGLSGNN